MRVLCHIRGCCHLTCVCVPVSGPGYGGTPSGEAGDHLPFTSLPVICTFSFHKFSSFVVIFFHFAFISLSVAGLPPAPALHSISPPPPRLALLPNDPELPTSPSAVVCRRPSRPSATVLAVPIHHGSGGGRLPMVVEPSLVFCRQWSSSPSIVVHPSYLCLDGAYSSMVVVLPRWSFLLDGRPPTWGRSSMVVVPFPMVAGGFPWW